jgi:hypothetical protein
MRRLSSIGVALAACAAVAGVTAHGGHAAAPNVLAITFQGGKYADVPDTVPGGAVALSLANQDKTPHSAQIIGFDDAHTAAQAYTEAIKDSKTTPDWIHAKGGLGLTLPKGTAKAEVLLDPGNYLVVDLFQQGNGKPAYKAFTVTEGAGGALSVKAPTITGAKVGKDRYAWQIAGTLKSTTKSVTFASKGSDALHFLGLFKVKGRPSKAKILKGLETNGRPPSFIDTTSFYNTAVLDGGLAQITPIALKGPGNYVLFCPLTDRDGGKSHIDEGMFKIVTVR